MAKRNVSFIVGLVVLLFIFLMLITIIIGVAAFRRNIPIIGRGVIALVKVEGILTDTTNEIELLRKYAENSLVRAIVLRIDSPGGSVGCSQELYAEVLKARKQSRKPIVASMGNVAASGGYYVACAADEIYANPGTVTGSIGVIFQSYDLRGLSQKVGVNVNTVKSGKFKDTGSYFREMTPDERKVLQGTIDDTYDQFLDAVLDGRRAALATASLRRSSQGTTASLAAGAAATTATTSALPLLLTPSQAERVPLPAVKEYLRSFADGRVLSGRQAQELGLVDSLGDLHDAIDRATKLAGLRGKPYVMQERRRVGFLDLLQGRANAVSQLAERLGVSLEYRLSME